MRTSTSYKLAGTLTFRLASVQILKRKRVIQGKTVDKGWGENLQNKEKSDRIRFLADPGMKLGQRDQSGAEALIVAYLCRHGQFRELFIHGIKPHIYVALRLFADIWKKKMHEYRLDTGDIKCDIDEIVGTPIAKLKKNPFWKSLARLIQDSDNWSLQERYYYLAKQTCHSGNYGITAPTFRMNVLEKSGGKINISKEEAERFIELYNSLFPEIREWHYAVRQQCERHRILYNMHGHPYQLTQYEFIESKWKELYAWVPQSTVGEITRVAFNSMQHYIESNHKRWDMLQDNHDSFLTQFPDSPNEEAEWLNVSGQALMQEFTSPIDGVKFRMKSEAQTGYNWAPSKEVYHEGKLVEIINPEGLREIK